MHRTRFLPLLSAFVALSCGNSTSGTQPVSGALGGAGIGAAGSAGAPPGNGGAGDGGSAAGGSAGGAGECGATRAGLVDAIANGMACTTDGDCTEYDAPCLQTEAGNCAGIFYVSKSALSIIQVALSTYEACVGQACDAGPTCALGGLPPACVEGVCGHQLFHLGREAPPREESRSANVGGGRRRTRAGRAAHATHARRLLPRSGNESDMR